MDSHPPDPRTAPSAPRSEAGNAPRSHAEKAPRSDAAARSGLAEALATVGDRWKLLVVAALLEGAGRFGEVQQAIPEIAPNILSQRLRQLEQEGLVIARPYSRRPPRFSYELTAAGHDLAGVLRLLSGWGERHREGHSERRHAACGTPLEARWYCPTCAEAVDEPDGDVDSGDLFYA
jgi:DNA-binding HxlR family transcriptional regulator